MPEKIWNDQGCEVCRQNILSGKPLIELSLNVPHHIRLLFCLDCKSLWCEEERFANVITKEKALEKFDISEPELNLVLEGGYSVNIVNFKPENDLEESLFKVQNGKVDLQIFLELLKESDIFVPSGTEINDDLSGFSPLLFEKENGSFVSVFTSQSRLAPFNEKTKYHIQMTGNDFFLRLPPNYGVVVNPGWRIGCEIDCNTIASQLKEK